MFSLINKYVAPILGTLVVVELVLLGLLYLDIKSKNKEISNLNTQLGVVAAMSAQQESKIVESKKVEEKLKVVTQDKIKVITEYVYDNNKSDCDNAAIILSNAF